MIFSFLIADWNERLAIFVTNPWWMIAEFAELLSFLAGVIYWRKFRGTSISWFIVFLGYNFFNEIAALLYYVNGLGDNNSIFYNIRQFIYISVLFYVFHNFLQKTRFKRYVVLVYVIWFLSFIYMTISINFLEEYALFSEILGSFLSLILVLFVFVHTINSLRLSEIGSNMFIYIGLGLLFYLVISIPTDVTTFFGWVKISIDAGPRMEFYSVLRNVGVFTGALMYFIFAYGFYRAKRPELVV